MSTLNRYEKLLVLLSALQSEVRLHYQDTGNERVQSWLHGASKPGAWTSEKLKKELSVLQLYRGGLELLRAKAPFAIYMKHSLKVIEHMLKHTTSENRGGLNLLACLGMEITILTRAPSFDPRKLFETYSSSINYPEAVKQAIRDFINNTVIPEPIEDNAHDDVQDSFARVAAQMNELNARAARGPRTLTDVFREVIENGFVPLYATMKYPENMNFVQNAVKEAIGTNDIGCTPKPLDVQSAIRSLAQKTHEQIMSAKPVKLRKPPKPQYIPLTVAEIESGSDRVQWAEGLIKQLPEGHDGRNSWLLNYGRDSKVKHNYPDPLPGFGKPVLGPMCRCSMVEVEEKEDTLQDLLKKYPHYYKDVSNLKVLDIYRFLSLFNVKDPCLQHAIKKLAVAGGRTAGKDITQDVNEAIATLNRWNQMRAEENAQTNSKHTTGTRPT